MSGPGAGPKPGSPALGGKAAGVEVIRDVDEPLTVLASDIKALSAAAAKLLSSPLKRHTIILLLQDASKLPKKTVVRMLDEIEGLARRYAK